MISYRIVSVCAYAIGFFPGTRHTFPQGQSERVCFNVTDEQLALTSVDGATVLYSGKYTLELFDGVHSVTVPAQVSHGRVIDTLPPVSNPQPACCSGSDRSCC